MKTTPNERLVFWAICEVVRSFWSLLMFTRQDMRCGCGITDFSEKCCDEELEMVHFTGDIYEKLVPQHLLPFYLSKIFQFSRQKLVLR